MKKLLILMFSILTISGVYAQKLQKVRGNGKVENKERKLKPFTKIDADVDFEITLLNNPFNKKIIVSGDLNLQNLILTKVENDVLTIKYKKKVEIVEQNAPLKIMIPSRDVIEYTHRGAGSLNNLGAIEVPNFTLNQLGTGSIELKLKNGETTLNLQNTGNILLKGTSNTLKIESSGNGEVKASELVTFFSQINLNGKGNIYLNTINGIDGEMVGEGNLYYKNTKVLNVENKGSGKIINLLEASEPNTPEKK